MSTLAIFDRASAQQRSPPENRGICDPSAPGVFPARPSGRRRTGLGLSKCTGSGGCVPVRRRTGLGLSKCVPRSGGCVLGPSPSSAAHGFGFVKIQPGVWRARSLTAPFSHAGFFIGGAPGTFAEGRRRPMGHNHISTDDSVTPRVPMIMQLTWLALGEDQAARSRRVEQLTAL